MPTVGTESQIHQPFAVGSLGRMEICGRDESFISSLSEPALFSSHLPSPPRLTFSPGF
jgi:hypothetical protein